MIKLQEIFNYLCELAPLELQMDFDNSGFLMGHADADIKKIICTLDVTDKVVCEAVELGAQLIISHHPLIWSAPKSVTDAASYTGRLLTLAENKIAVISMHTNLDCALGGVNDVLIRKFCTLVEEGRVDGCGRIGILDEPMSMNDFLMLCKKRLSCKGIRYYDSGRKVHRIAVLGGAGAGALQEVFLSGCDTYITADVKYHQFLEACELGINLIDADHFYTENPVIHDLSAKISSKFPDMEVLVSQVHSGIIEFA